LNELLDVLMGAESVSENRLCG